MFIRSGLVCGGWGAWAGSLAIVYFFDGGAGGGGGLEAVDGFGDTPPVTILGVVPGFRGVRGDAGFLAIAHLFGGGGGGGGGGLTEDGGFGDTPSSMRSGLLGGGVGSLAIVHSSIL